MIYFLVLVGCTLCTIQANSMLDAEINGCPEKSVVEPCTCKHYSSMTYLECVNVDDTDTLSNVFIRSSKYRYTEVHIVESVLQFLPSDMFQGVQVKELHLKNVTLVQLFDDPPEHLQMLDVLRIEMTNVFRGMSWELLKPMKDLRILTIYYDSIPYLDREFSDQVTERLKQLTFYGTETTVIKSGALSKYKDLEIVAFDACGLTELKRNIFPVPFNVKVLYFNDNKLTKLPTDMFTAMPNLQTLGLRKNLLTLLPETAFESIRLKKLEYLFLEDNPIECDCRLLWLIRNKPIVLTGKCKNMQEIELKDIKDLTC